MATINSVLCFFRKRVVLGVIFLFSLIYCLLQFQLINLNKKLLDTEFDENIIVKRENPFIWRTLLTDNLTDINESCRNSIQGRTLIVDDRGFVCDRQDLLKTGCCKIEAENTKLYYCGDCNQNKCCVLYENCVSCCLNPEQVPMLEKLLSKSTDRQSMLYLSLNDQFELCLSKCRTNSHSVKNENRYRDQQYKFCFGVTKPHASIIAVI